MQMRYIGEQHLDNTIVYIELQEAKTSCFLIMFPNAYYGMWVVKMAGKRLGF